MSRYQLRLGLVGADQVPWEYVRDRCAALDVELELKLYEDYFSPNEDLNSGKLELNAFQHRVFLAQEKEEKGYDFVVLGTIYFDPIGLYSASLASLFELTAGASIAYPQDPTNALRSLKILQHQGLLRLEHGQVVDNPLNLRLIPKAAHELVSELPEVSAAFINGNYAFAAGLSPATDPIVREQFSGFEDDNPYVKVIVCPRDLQPELLQAARQVTGLYRTPEVAALIKTMQGGSLIPAF